MLETGKSLSRNKISSVKIYIYDLFIILNSLWFHTVLYTKINVISQVGWPIQELNVSLYMLPVSFRSEDFFS